MFRALIIGAAAGAVGTVALNAATYADMTIRGRPASTTPAQVAGALADRAGLDLSAGQGEAAKEQTENRKSGLGALFGYGTGVGVGAAYGLLAPLLRWFLPGPLRGIAVGLAAMAATDTPVARLGVSDPATWGPADWTADLLPHLVYGLVTVAAYETFSGRSQKEA
jgi:hypothetical protein